MAKTISIDPVTRIEGHLAIETQVEAGRVTEARVTGRMYRGFENLLLGRHPVDAARITQRICGICHEVHGIAASMALEDLYKLAPTHNGKVLRELILGLHLVTDHLFHFYQLTLPDYVDFAQLSAYRGADSSILSLEKAFRQSAMFAPREMPDAIREVDQVAEMALAYAAAIHVRKDAGSGLASLGGKVPFCHAILPGGMTTEITTDRLVNYINALEKTADFVNRYYVPQALLLAERFASYFAIGQAQGNFYGNSGFVLLKEPLFKSGIQLKGAPVKAVQFRQIEEVIDATYLDAKGHPQYGKSGAYSWVKAMRYQGAPLEVGPLARMAVNHDDGFLELLKRFGQLEIHSSVMGRILARAHEARKICAYLQDLLSSYRLGESTINPPDMSAAPTGTGTGMSLAARGALNHQVIVKDGKVSGYKLQVPSTWNFGPTVNGERGTVEEALVGTQLSGSKPDGKGGDAIEVGRIVRSFDPCLACAIH